MQKKKIVRHQRLLFISMQTTNDGDNLPGMAFPLALDFSIRNNSLISRNSTPMIDYIQKIHGALYRNVCCSERRTNVIGAKLSFKSLGIWRHEK